MGPETSEESQVFIETCKNAWKARFHEKRVAMEHRKHALLEAARACATHLKVVHGVKEVLVFGSVAGERPVHEGSDVDLATTGLKDEGYFTVLHELHEITRRVAGLDVPVDLITLESAPPRLKSVIMQTGVEI